MDAIKALFIGFGDIENVKVIKDQYSGQPKGFGFIEMPSNSEADKAIKALNGSRVNGNHIIVRPADSGRKKRSKKRPSHKRGY